MGFNSAFKKLISDLIQQHVMKNTEVFIYCGAGGTFADENWCFCHILHNFLPTWTQGHCMT